MKRLLMCWFISSVESVWTAAGTESPHQQAVVSGSRSVTISESSGPWSSVHSGEYFEMLNSMNSWTLFSVVFLWSFLSLLLLLWALIVILFLVLCILLLGSWNIISTYYILKCT